jgi:hypothetical protein
VRIGNSRSYLDCLGFPRCRFGPVRSRNWQQFYQSSRARAKPNTYLPHHGNRLSNGRVGLSFLQCRNVVTTTDSSLTWSVTVAVSNNEVSRSSKLEDKPLSSLLHPNMEPEVDILQSTYRFPVAYGQDRPRSVRDLLTSRRIPLNARGGCIAAPIRQFCRWRC